MYLYIYIYIYVCVCVYVCLHCFSTVTFHYWKCACARESQKGKETSLIIIIANVINKMTLSYSPKCQLNLWTQQSPVYHVRENFTPR